MTARSGAGATWTLRIRDEPGGGAPRHNYAAWPSVSGPALEAATGIEPVCRALQYRLDPAKSLVIRACRMNPDYPTRDSRRLRPWAMAVNAFGTWSVTSCG